MSSLETRIDGSPASVRAVATWLRDDFGDSAEELASSVHRQRSRAGSAWEGEAASGFGSASRTLGAAGDDTAAAAGAVATEVDVLAMALERAQEQMHHLRSDAAAGGLTVSGTVVHGPAPAPPNAGFLPADATPPEVDAWQRADQRVRDHNETVRAWDHANAEARRIFQEWADALTEAATAWERWDKELVGATAALLSAGTQVELVRRTVPELIGEADRLRQEAVDLRRRADALVDADGRVDRAHFYDLLDRADDAEVRAGGFDDAARGGGLPRGLTRGLVVLDVLATGYNIHEDMEEGESAAQATVSNVAGMGASIAAGAYIGGVVGTAIPVPVLGTAAGVVVGAVAGTVVGAFTSGVLDSVWENGVDSLGDAGDAVMDGLEEVGNVGEAVGDLAEDAWDAIF